MNHITSLINFERVLFWCVYNLVLCGLVLLLLTWRVVVMGDLLTWNPPILEAYNPER